jgi:hypothetical protein
MKPKSFASKGQKVWFHVALSLSALVYAFILTMFAVNLVDYLDRILLVMLVALLIGIAGLIDCYKMKRSGALLGIVPAATTFVGSFWMDGADAGEFKIVAGILLVPFLLMLSIIPIIRKRNNG